MTASTIYSGSSIITSLKKIWFGPFSDSNSLLITKANTIPAITSIGTETGYIPVNYTLENSLSKTSSIKVYYSTNSGLTWSEATRYTSSGDANTGLSTSPSGTAHSFYWDSYTDMGYDFVGSVIIKIISYDRDNYIGDFIETNYEQIIVNNAPYAPVLVSPPDSFFYKDDTPEFIMEIPENPNPDGVYTYLFPKIEVDTSENFHGNDLVRFEAIADQTGWQYKNASNVWADIPSTGIPISADIVGNYVRYIVQTNHRLQRTLLYWRGFFSGTGVEVTTGKRATYTLPATTGVETDLVFRFIVTYDSDMNADFSDIRFYDSDDVTLLKHDRFSYTDSTTATFYVKVPSKLAAGQKIYMHYKDASLTDASDPDNVYLKYDNFTGVDGTQLSLDKWHSELGGQPSVYIYGNAARHEWFNIRWFSNESWDFNIGIIYRKESSDNIAIARTSGIFYDDGTNAIFAAHQQAGETDALKKFVCVNGTAITGLPTLYNTYRVIEIRKLSNVSARFFMDGVDYGVITGTTPYTTSYVGFQNYTTASPVGRYEHYDWVYVFKLPSDGTEVPDFTTPDLVENI